MVFLDEDENHSLPPLFLTEFNLDVHCLSFIPNVEDFHDIISDVILRYSALIRL